MPDLAYRHLAVDRDDDVLVLTPAGPELRGAKLSAALLRELLAAHAEHGAPAKVILDLGHVDYLASLGLATLLRFRRYLQGQDARLLLVHVAPFLGDILHASRLTGDVFALADDHAAARQALSAG